MYCANPACSKLLPSDVNFCGYCGTSTEQAILLNTVETARKSSGWGPYLIGAVLLSGCIVTGVTILVIR